MKSRVQITLLLTACTVLFLGCDNPQQTSNPRPGGATARAVAVSAEMAGEHPLGQPWDYFPTDIGHRWSYRITIPEGRDALNHRVVSWASGDKGGVRVETRGRYLPDKKGTKSSYRLVISIKKQAPKQGPLSYPEGYEIGIDEDELGIFESTMGVFLAVSRNPRYSVDLVTTHDPSSSSAPHTGSPWGTSYNKPGFGMRVYFFGEKPGVQIGLSDQNDAVLFDGPEKLNGKNALKFIRKVEASKKTDFSRDIDKGTSVLDKGFEEEMYFVRGVGLAKLTQKVDGKITMTWELE
ncbi:MAG: hypothetical protein WC250_01315 [Candidatus Paceibacterota bacterium]|jgi:hypothetical protein